MDGKECDYADPLPTLLGYGRVTAPGEWLGDIIGASDELQDDIEVIECITLDWQAIDRACLWLTKLI